MLIGVNLPWFEGAYGHDLGTSPAHPEYPIAYDPERVDQTLARLSGYGVSLVRIWLFENCEGIRCSADGEIVGIDPIFLHNVDHLAGALADHGMQAYWTLLDANSVDRNHDAVTRSILINPTVTDQFLRLCLLPTLQRVACVTWGLDLCNEPEALVYDGRLNGGGWEETWSQVVSGLCRMLDVLDETLPDIPVGVGSGYYEGTAWEELLRPRLGRRLQIVDYHSHRRGSQISLVDPRPSSGQWLVLGELGVGGIDRDASRQEWRETQEYFARKLRTLREYPFKAVFVWFLSSTSSAHAASLFFKDEPSPVLRLIQDINAENGRAKERAYRRAPTSASQASGIRLPLHLRQMGGVSSCGHRSGWRYVLDCLGAVDCNSPVVLDDFVERTFQWPDCKQIWRAPWVGVIHHPPNFPAWLEATAPLDVILDSPRFRASLPMLKGVVVLSEHLRSYVESRLQVPVWVLKHPSEIPDQRFSFDAYLNSQSRQVVQVGYFSRNIRAINQLHLPEHYERIHLFDERPWCKVALDRIDTHSPWKHRPTYGGVRRLSRLSNDAYDALMGRSIVLCEYFDASASNTVIECIARDTPIVVNRSPAVVEYLGSDYPLYFDEIAEVGELLNDDRVYAAHDYLRSLDKGFLSGESFAREISKLLESLG